MEGFQYGHIGETRSSSGDLLEQRARQSRVSGYEQNCSIALPMRGGQRQALFILLLTYCRAHYQAAWSVISAPVLRP